MAQSSEKLGEYKRKRNFSKTAEPSGDSRSTGSDGLRFVIQKHDASHLHYDLRLEMDGVMRSWAVPKGPSIDPAVRRLAMEVEDHPIAYNDFEGTIPAGEYGGGTVMLWDRGSYLPDELNPEETPEAAVLRGYDQGKLSFTLNGERLRGSFALVRTDAVKGGPRSKWLLLKHRDEDADPDVDITEEVRTSVASGRTMDEIASGKGGSRVWRSNRNESKRTTNRRAKSPSVDLATFTPMMATPATRVPTSGKWTFEPKYDGVRVLAFATPDTVALVTRNGRDKAPQFPEVAAEIAQLVADLGVPIVLDGEIVALDKGKIVRFEELQNRMHIGSRRQAARLAEERPAAFITFDILLAGDEALPGEKWEVRRRRLENTLTNRQTEGLRLSETSSDHEALARRAEREGWEGIVAKRIDSRYRPGQRTKDWLKLKLDNQQELVVGGWTEPRKSRTHLGAILLGYYDERGDLIYAGHAGSGFTRATLEEMHRRLRPLERKTPPFTTRPETNEPAHWVTPKVVVEVKFSEWTRDGKLRHPVFLGFRDDKDPREVVREPDAVTLSALTDPEPEGKDVTRNSAEKQSTSSRRASDRTPDPGSDTLEPPVFRRLQTLRAEKGEGTLTIGGGSSLEVTSLEKVFYPKTGHTKGDLLQYYARMARFILPRMKDRPLVLKRFPNGVEGESFYQQAAPDNVPTGVRVETLHIEGKEQRRLVGGNLTTLLYTIQLGAISYDPWHSRIQNLESADYTVLDLDPGPGVDFQGVVEVARLVKEEMDELGLHGALKTSGSSGIHIYLPLPRDTPLEAATLVAQIIATRVANRHPKVATVERMTKKRPRGTVYVDYLQNILGKTVAGVYAARAKDAPTVSTPLAWDELGPDLDLKAFTIDTVPQRVRQIGDLWGPAMAKRNSMDALAEAAPSA